MFRFLVMTLLFILGSSVCAAESSYVQSPGFKLDGRSAADWSAAWWMWAMSSPDDINPVRDNSGAHCGTGQEGKVWFLAGGFGSSFIKRNCTVPAGKYIFFPIINMAYWPQEENNGFTCKQAIRNAAINNDTAIDLIVELDGVAISNPKRFRASTKKCFDVYGRVPKEYKPFNAYPSASDGYWILLSPLPIGKHAIRFIGQYNNTTAAFGHMLQDIEYQIVIR
jgi:hypothetical protein